MAIALNNDVSAYDIAEGRYVPKAISAVAGDYVLRAGDGMTGDLVITKDSPAFVVNTNNSATINAFEFRASNVRKAAVQFVGAGHATTGRREDLELRNETAAGKVTIFTNNVERVRVAADGKVGVNRTPTTYQLEVGGDIYTTGSFRGDGSQLAALNAGNLTTGTVALARGGTGANLSATGGASQVLMQTTAGGAVTVAQLSAANLSNGTTGTGAVVLASALSAYQPLDSTLTALAAFNANGILVQTAADAFAARTLTGPAAGITVTNGNGVSGNPSLALAHDLAALEGLGGTGLAVRTAADTWAQRVVAVTASTGLQVTNADGVSGNITLAGVDASTTVKGVASFNPTNFTAAAGSINTVQNIDTAAAPTFGGMTVQSALPPAYVLATTGVTAKGRLIQPVNHWLGLTFNAWFDAVGGAWRLDDTARQGWVFSINDTNAFLSRLTAGAGNRTHNFAVFIDSSNRIGIGGITDPAYLFESVGSSGVNVRAANPGTNERASISIGANAAASTGWAIGQSIGANAAKDFYIFDASNTATRLAISTTGIVTVGVALRSTSFTSGLVGWAVSADGSAEFANVRVRGELVTTVFKYNEITATAGTLAVTISASTLAAAFTTPGAVGGTGSMLVKNSDGGAALFNTSSRINIRTWTGATLAVCWFTVTAVTNNGNGTSTLSVTLQAGTTGVSLPTGTAVVDYGPSGSGAITLSTDGAIGATPSITLFTHAGSPWSAMTPRVRIGNLNGWGPYSTNVYGFAAGAYGGSEAWVFIDPGNGLRMGSGAVGKIQLNPDGSGYLANSSISWDTSGNLTVAASATIAGWSVTAAKLSSGVVTLAANSDVVTPTGGSTLVWFGKSTTGYVGWDFRKDAGGGATVSLQAIANNGSLRPYFNLHDGTRYRVVIGELNNAWGAEGLVNALGMKIWDGAGNLLVHFSNAANQIGGWTIGANTLSNNSVLLDAGSTDGIQSNTSRTWIGYANMGGTTAVRGLDVRYYPGSGSVDYGVQVLSYAGVDSGKPYFTCYDAGRTRVVVGTLNYGWNGDALSASMGLKIWGTSGTYLVEFSGVRNVIAGWTISQTSISSGGINLISSATAASNKIYVGTGTFNNSNTGFYVDGAGYFSLKDKLSWDGSTLTINGNGTFSGTLSSAVFDTGSSNPAQAARFGGTGIGGVLPLYVSNGAPMVGFNTYWSNITPVYGMSGYAARIYMSASTGDIFFNVAASGTAGGTLTGDSTRMIVKNGGHVGIGTVSPNVLGVASSTYGRVVTISSTDSTGRALLELHMNSATSAVDNAIGQVGFVNGSTNTGAVLVANQTAGSSSNSYMAFYTLDAGSLTEKVRIYAGGTMRLLNYGAGSLSTDASGNITVTSDLRLKNVVGLFTAGRAALRPVQPITYRWRKESGLDTVELYHGWSAQNLLASIPQAVGRMNGGGRYLTVTDRTVLAVVVNACNEYDAELREHRARIEALEARNAVLESRLAAFESANP